MLIIQMLVRNGRAIILVNGELCARERSSPKNKKFTDVSVIFMNIYIGAHSETIHQLFTYIHSQVWGFQFRGQNHMMSNLG